MKVRDLIHELLAHNLDADVIVAQYDGGSFVDHAHATTVMAGRFVADVGASGNVYDIGRFIAAQYLSSGNHGGTPAVLILPND